MTIKEELFALQDISYGDFQSKLIPGIPRELFIGVRVPECRWALKIILFPIILLLSILIAFLKFIIKVSVMILGI